MPQIDLDIGQVGRLAQVVLANQAVEIDRRRGADIDLVIGYLGQGCNLVTEFAEHARIVFEAAAFR